jgi:hypothetical protein
MPFKSKQQQAAVMSKLRQQLKVGSIDVQGIRKVKVMGYQYPHYGFYDPRKREIKLRTSFTAPGLHPKLVARHEVGHHVLYSLPQPTRLNILNKMSRLKGGPRLSNAQYWPKRGYNAHESFADAYAVLRNKQQFFGKTSNPIAHTGWDSATFHRDQYKYRRVVGKAIRELRKHRRLQSALQI